MRTTMILPVLVALALMPTAAQAVPAFPTCEGFGCPDNTGGRGGLPIYVTNTSDGDSGYCQPGDSDGGTAPEFDDACTGNEAHGPCVQFCTNDQQCNTCSSNTQCVGAAAGSTCTNGFCGGSAGACVEGPPGSFRRALMTERPRYVLFRTAGTIDLESRMRMSTEHSNVYVAGQSAPGDGVQFRGESFLWGGNIHDVVVRHLRVRQGTHNYDNVDANPPGFFVWYGADDLAFDHVSLAWHLDDTFAVGGWVQDVTFQWGVIAEGADSHRYCPSTGRADCGDNADCGGGSCLTGGNTHSKGGLVGGSSSAGNNFVSLHHNLLAHNSTRQMNMRMQKMQYVNNLIHNFDKGVSLVDSHTTTTAQVWLEGNYFRQGEDGSGAFFGELGGNWAPGSVNFRTSALDGYIHANVSQGYCGSLASPCPDWGSAATPMFRTFPAYTGGGGSPPGCATSSCTGAPTYGYTRLESPPEGFPDIDVDDLVSAYDTVLANAGAGGGIGKRDLLDERLSAEVRYGRCTGNRQTSCSSNAQCAGNGVCFLNAPDRGHIGCGISGDSLECREFSRSNQCCTGNGTGAGCPTNAACTALGDPYVCCDGPGTGSCGTHFPSCCTGEDRGWCDWPTMRAGTPYADTDGDGIDDDWENAREGMAAVGAGTDLDGNGYDDLEDFLNQLAGDDLSGNTGGSTGGGDTGGETTTTLPDARNARRDDKLPGS